MPESTRANLLLPSLIISIGVAAAGYFIGQTMYNSKVGINTAEVKGLAERRVEADRARMVKELDRADVTGRSGRAGAGQAA